MSIPIAVAGTDTFKTWREKTNEIIAGFSDVSIHAGADPSATDDLAGGYRLGSAWINTTAESIFYCLDSTNGSAMWMQVADMATLLALDGAIDAATLDGLDSTSFLRSDAAIDAATLDGLDSTSFLRSDAALDADLLDGMDSTEFASKVELNGAIGNINNPLLHMPLNNSLSMTQGAGEVVFERTSTATFVDIYGEVQHASIDEPRFEKNGLLVEGPSTNLFTYSQEFLDTNTDWSNIRSSVTDNAVTAPDGTTTAASLIEDISAVNNHYLNNPTNITAGLDYTMSAFVKANGRDWVRLYFPASAFGVAKSIDFDIANGVVGTVNNEMDHWSIEELHDGWYRISGSVAATTTTASADQRFQIMQDEVTSSYAGDGVSGVYIWGAQLEEMRFPTSYVPTTTASATRNGDSCLVTLRGNHPKVETGTEYTIATKGSMLGETHSFHRHLYSAGDSATVDAEYSMLRSDPGVRAQGFYRSGVSHGTGALTKNVLSGIVATIAHDDTLSVYKDGQQVTSAVRVPTNYTQIPPYIALGSTTTKTLGLYGHIKDFKIFDKALTPVEVNLL